MKPILKKCFIKCCSFVKYFEKLMPFKRQFQLTMQALFYYLSLNDYFNQPYHVLLLNYTFFTPLIKNIISFYHFIVYVASFA